MAFLDTLESKYVELHTGTVTAVWILDNTFPYATVDRFHLLFHRCLSLEHHTIIGELPCSRILETIPKLPNGAHAPREPTIIYLGRQIASNFNSTFLSKICSSSTAHPYFICTCLCEWIVMDCDWVERKWTCSEQFPKFYVDSRALYLLSSA